MRWRWGEGRGIETGGVHSQELRLGAVDYDVAECDLDWLISALVGRRDGVEVMEQVRRLKLKDRVGIEVRKGGNRARTSSVPTMAFPALCSISTSCVTCELSTGCESGGLWACSAIVNTMGEGMVSGKNGIES